MVPDEIAKRIVTAARHGRQHGRKTREWEQRRDGAIIEAIKAGGTQREVAKLAGLTQPAVSGIWRRHEEARSTGSTTS